jgi:hypothetical protein
MGIMRLATGEGVVDCHGLRRAEEFRTR